MLDELGSESVEEDCAHVSATLLALVESLQPADDGRLEVLSRP